MREYQNLKSAVTKVLENASNVIVTRTTVKDRSTMGLFDIDKNS